MAHKPTILVAGYGSWPKAKKNPAAQVALALNARRWHGFRVIGVEVPVDSNSLMEHITQLFDTHAPDAWVGLGVSQAAIVQAEMVGINWRHFDVPDAQGVKLAHTPILEDGPVAYNATLPNGKMVDALRQAEIPAALSFSAGTHLCNQMLYATAHVIAQRNLPTLTGFVHIPQTSANVAEADSPGRNSASMPLSMSTDAIALCVKTIVAELTSYSPSNLNRKIS